MLRIQAIEKILKGKSYHIKNENMDKVPVNDYIFNKRKILNLNRICDIMEDSYDKSKIIDCMFDPNISEILAELEHGGKEISYLVEKSGISEDEIKNKLSYLLEHNFLTETIESGKTVFSANAEKLAKIMENEENFEGAMDGLAKMDSYLN